MSPACSDGRLGSSRKRPLEHSRVLHREALPVVVQVQVDLGARAPGGYASGPRLELASRVVAAPAAMPVMEADEGPVGGQLPGLERPAWVVADDEGHPVPAEQV